MSGHRGPLRWPAKLDVRRFLTGYWQGRPLLMRAALPGIAWPLDAHELAGLACEPDVESRIVQEHGVEAPWQLSHGPFDAADLLFANGLCHGLPAGRGEFLTALCRRPALTADAASPWLQGAHCVSLLTTRFNLGHVLVEEE